MNGLHVILDGDGALKPYLTPSTDVQHYTTQDYEVLAVYLTGGMGSGKPSCFIDVIDREHNRVIMVETSVELFLAAARAFRARMQMEGFDVP